MQEHQLVNELQDCFVPNHFFGSIHPEIEPAFELGESCFEALVHGKGINGFLSEPMEVLPRPADFDIIQIGHHFPEAIIEEAEQQAWVLFDLYFLDQLDVDLVLPIASEAFNLQGRLQRVDIETPDDGFV